MSSTTATEEAFRVLRRLLGQPRMPPQKLENCSFGKSLATGMIKHTNLTGGGAAYSGGELILLNQYTMVVNGRSGRYGPRNATELYSAVKAFADSGYRVWYMPWDEDANRPAPFGSFPNLFP
jgi:hypothetical protein